MYSTFDEEVFLAPESIISGVLATAESADHAELPDIEPVLPSWRAAVVIPDADADDAGADDPEFPSAHADSVDAWSRHARGTSGFGG